MPDDIPGHDVRDEHRNTDNFAKGVEEHAPNYAADQGLEIAGEASGMSAGETFYLNAKDGEGSEDGTTYVATDDPDIFVYDFSTADTTNDTFEIYNYDSSEDTLIFINAEVPLAPGDNGETATSIQYIDPEFESPILQVYYVYANQLPNPNYSPLIVYSNYATGVSTSTPDGIYLYADEGITQYTLNQLDYPDDTMYPTPDPTYAHVYEGDPLAVEGLA